MIKRRDFVQAIPLITLQMAGVSANAQSSFPRKPITLVVSSPPGGQSDLISRYLSDLLSREFGQPVIIENKPGANGAIGLQYAAKQPADGHTIVYGVAAWMAINPGFYPNLPYDPQKDFDPITQLGIAPQCLMLGAHVPAKTLAEFIQLAKTSPGKYTFASFGNGSTSHMQGEMLKRLAGIDMLHVPFKGSAQAIQELLAGRVDSFIIDFSPAAGFIKDGRIRGVAVTGTVRSPEFPEIPTFQQQGYALNLVGWNGLYVPAGTPKEIVGLLNKKLNAIIQSEAGRVKLTQLALLPTGTTPEEFRRILSEDIPKWREIIKLTGAKPD
jgi:tripartite-type tricarboxylate transporter receptor subunit TctC